MGKKKKNVQNEKQNTMTLDELVARLTLDEKISLVSGKDFWRTVNIDRLHIPSIMLSDGPHGLRKQPDGGDHLGVSKSITAVCFPAASALAASFDKKTVYETGRTLGEECQAEDIAVLLGPAINIKRSPLGGRNFEYFSEDPYLTGELACAYIDGVQSTGTGTSLKHFAVNNQEKRRMTVSAEVDERALREIYLKGFENAVKRSNPYSVMCSYNRVNGEQISESELFLTDILKKEWGYKGFVVSDWGAVKDRSKGLKAGLDLEMPASYGVGERNIRKALKDGSLEESDLDKACRRILNAVFKFKQNRQSFDFDREIHHEKAKEIALNTAVLLKNDNSVLPLDKKKTTVFIGEFAEKPRYQGGGSSHIRAYRVSGILDCVRDDPRVKYAKGFDITSDKIDKALIDEAVTLASDSDTAVIFAGLPDSYESEGFDRKHLRLPDNQNELIKAVCKVQKNVAVVLHNGSPVEMPWIDSVSSVLECYLGGEAVGEAQYDLLFGNVSPSGKLPETFPLRLSDSGCYEYFPGTANTVEYRESIYVGYRYYSTFAKKVLFPFGHGLSYTKFKYSDIKADNKNIFADHGANVSVTVTNTGDRPGAEVVQLYISPLDSRVISSRIELKGFEKVFLAPGESKSVSFRLEDKDFAYYNVNEKAFVCQNGSYDILIGSSSEDIRLRDRFILSGFKNYDCPYSLETNRVYSSDVSSLTRSDFESLAGRKIETDIPGVPLTINNSIGDALGTPHADRIETIVKLVAPFVGGKSDEEMIVSGAMEMPIRSLVAMSGGMFNEKMGQAIVDFLNGEKLAPALVKLVSSKFTIGKDDSDEK